MLEIIGKIARVVGPVVHAREVMNAKMLDLVEVGEEHLVGEIVKLDRDRAAIQVYEDTTGLRPGSNIYSPGVPLSVELGPGLLGTIYDGVQRPLEIIRDTSGSGYIQKGIHATPLMRERRWEFVPTMAIGTAVEGGEIFGTIQETPLIEHRLLVPPEEKGRVAWIAPAGSYSIDEIALRLEGASGAAIEVKFHQRWPVRTPRPSKARLPLRLPLITGQRVIDTLFPQAKGGTVVVPGGFGHRGIEGKIRTGRYARENQVPYLGLCLGLQTMVIELARHAVGTDEPNSTEFDPGTKSPVIDLLPEQVDVHDLGGTMRLGAWPCRIVPGTRTAAAYGVDLVHERHRHRFEVNNAYRDLLTKAGMVFSGLSPDGRLVEIGELADHPFMVGSQFHPEFKSRPTRPHPMFQAFVRAALDYQVAARTAAGMLAAAVPASGSTAASAVPAPRALPAGCRVPDACSGIAAVRCPRPWPSFATAWLPRRTRPPARSRTTRSSGHQSDFRYV